MHKQVISQEKQNRQKILTFGKNTKYKLDGAAKNEKKI